MDNETLNEVNETLSEMLGEINLLDSTEVWKKISSFKNWELEKPVAFAIQGRIIESNDRKMIEVDSINIPKMDTISFSFQKTYSRDSRGMNEGYTFSVMYPQNILVIVADTFKPIAKIINLTDGSVTMSSQ